MSPLLKITTLPSFCFKKKTQVPPLPFSLELTRDFGPVCLTKNNFLEITFQTFLCLFVIRKVGQWKTLFSQRKILLGFQESVFLLF
jgi:hypothetical protein